jgi:hypothetical protein
LEARFPFKHSYSTTQQQNIMPAETMAMAPYDAAMVRLKKLVYKNRIRSVVIHTPSACTCPACCFTQLPTLLLLP